MTVLWGVGRRLRLSRLMLLAGADVSAQPDRFWTAGADVVAITDTGATDAAVARAVSGWRAVSANRRGLVGRAMSAGRRASTGVDFVLVQSGEPLPRLDDGEMSAAAEGKVAGSLIGRVCASIGDMDEALADDTGDFLLVDGAAGGGGLELVAHAVAQAPPADPLSKPWFAAGVIDHTTIVGVLAAGARRVAVGRAVWAASDPCDAVRSLADAVRASWTDMDAVALKAFGRR